MEISNTKVASIKYNVYQLVEAVTQEYLKIKEVKGHFEVKLAENIKDDAKSFYAYTLWKLKTKEKVGPLIDPNGYTVTDNVMAANLLNEYLPLYLPLSQVTPCLNLDNILWQVKSDELLILSFSRM